MQESLRIKNFNLQDRQCEASNMWYNLLQKANIEWRNEFGIENLNVNKVLYSDKSFKKV